MIKLFAKLRESELGATAIEYGLIAALVAVAGIAGFQAVGDQIDANFDNIDTALTTVNGEVTEANNAVQ